jgi:hypothetical protein
MERYAVVIGRVKLWGKVIPGEWGWRAQYAYPSSLLIVDTLVGDVLNRNPRIHSDLQRYRVPTEFISPRELMEYTPMGRRAQRPARRRFWDLRRSAR